MPIYEYQCTHCGFLHEQIQKMSDSAKKKCPVCKKMTLKKNISQVAFRLKGGGWYETDFKTGNKKKGVVGEGGDTGSDSKPADADKADKDTGKKAGEDKTPSDKSDQTSKAGRAKAGSAS